MDEAFKVIERSGRTYRIYADGRTEGFAKDAMIFNRIPRLMREHHLTMAIASPLPTTKITSLDAGGTHDSAPADRSQTEKIRTAPGEK